MTAPEPKAKSRFLPRVRLASEHVQKQIWMAIAAVAVAAAIGSPWIINHQNRQMPVAIVLDGGGTFHVGPLETIGSTSDVLVEIVLQGCKGIFDRNRNGLENSELIRRLFMPSALTKLNNDVQWQKPDLEARDLRQQATIGEVTIVRESRGARFFRASGTINSAGHVRGSRISDTEPFVILISVLPNPNLSDRRRYPFLVADFRIDEPARPPGIYAD